MKLLLTLLSLISSEGEFRGYNGYNRGDLGGYNRGFNGGFNGGYRGGNRYGRGGNRYGRDRKGQYGQYGQNGSINARARNYQGGNMKYVGRTARGHNNGNYSKKRNRGHVDQFGNRQRGQMARNARYGSTNNNRRRMARNARYGRQELQDNQQRMHKKGAQGRQNRYDRSAGRKRAHNKNNNFGYGKKRNNVFQGRRANRSNKKSGRNKQYNKKSGTSNNKRISFKKDDEKSYQKNTAEFDMDSNTTNFDEAYGKSNEISSNNRDMSSDRYGKNEDNATQFGSKNDRSYDSWDRQDKGNGSQYRMNDQGYDAQKTRKYAGHGQNNVAADLDRNNQRYGALSDKKYYAGATGKLSARYNGSDQQSRFNNRREDASLYKDQNNAKFNDSKLHGRAASGGASGRYGDNTYAASHGAFGGARGY